MILVTGAAGHIGNVLVRELIHDGEKVRVLVLPGEDTTSLQGFDLQIVEGDVLNLKSLEKAMRDVDLVFHLAGVISIMPGQNAMMRKVNVEGTRNVLAAAKKAGVKRLVYTSSIHALSRDCKGKIDESVPFDAHNPAGEYDRTKAEASLVVLEAVHNGLDAVIVCPTGVIGPHDYRGSEMGDLLRTWLRKRPHVLIKGAFDFVDVRDVARGHILAARRGRKGEVYILSGWNIKLLELKQMAQQVLGWRSLTITLPTWLAKFGAHFTTLYYKIMHQRPKFTGYSIETVQGNSNISNRKARKELGYYPRKMLTTITDTMHWWRMREKRQRIR